MTVTLRAATAEDIDLLRAWDRMDHVRAAMGEEFPTDWQVELAQDAHWYQLYLACEDARPFGVVQIIDPALEDTHYWGQVPAGCRAIDIWIGPPSDLGRGLGTLAMTLAVEHCFAAPEVTEILIDPLAANTRAQRFYSRLGFQAVERRWFGADDCLVMRLTRPTGVAQLEQA